jgi:acetylglutamate kinase
VPTCPRAVEDALAAGLVPVVTPLARGPLNVNADDAAAALAVGIGAERIVFQSDVPGVLIEDAVAQSLSVSDLDELIEELEGGIVPKLQAAAAAARLGVRAEIGATAVVA